MDAVAQVGDVGALDDRRRSLQLDRSARQLVKEGGPAAEQDRDEVDPDLVEQARVEALRSRVPCSCAAPARGSHGHAGADALERCLHQQEQPGRDRPDAPLGTAGLITYLILDDQQRVDVLDVLWAAD